MFLISIHTPRDLEELLRSLKFMFAGFCKLPILSTVIELGELISYSLVQKEFDFDKSFQLHAGSSKVQNHLIDKIKMR